MSWQEIDLSAISPVIEPLPAGRKFKWQLLPGAKYSDFDPNKVEVQAAVSEGEFAGRKMFFSYPDPARFDWSPRVFMRLVHAIGEDLMPGEAPTQYLNRVAGSGVQFAAPVKQRATHVDGAGEQTVAKTDLDIFHVEAA